MKDIVFQHQYLSGDYEGMEVNDKVEGIVRRPNDAGLEPVRHL